MAADELMEKAADRAMGEAGGEVTDPAADLLDVASAGGVAAAVDIGTNSVKLTVARRAADGGLTVLLDTTKVTRLGKNVDASGRLDPEAVRRTLDALGEYGEQARAHGAARVAAVGTSALRDAANGAEFLTEAARHLGGPVEVISGEREAMLVYNAARRDPEISRAVSHAPTLATMDIGGGSTEFVLGRGGRVLFHDSLQLGAVRLTERVGFSDPPTEKERAEAARLADASLSVVPALDGPAALVGSGGTIANLAAMELRAANPGAPVTPDTLHGVRLTREQIEARIRHLASLPLAGRRGVPGLEPDRADVIVAGAIIQARALHRLNATTVLVSARGVRFGLLYEMLDEMLDE